ncbi:hypothetical protein AgCh_009792 [Apium graveolens]
MKRKHGNKNGRSKRHLVMLPGKGVPHVSNDLQQELITLYSKQELDTALEDYFEVIDTSMDFGTICSNLENGATYLNSEDMYKDVELIWNN